MTYFEYTSPSPNDGLCIRRVSRSKRTLHLIVISIRHAPTIGTTHHPLSRLEGSARGPVLSRTRSLMASTLVHGLSRRKRENLLTLSLDTQG